NFDLLYRFPEAAQTRWTPYVGGGFNYTMTHKSFATEEELGNDVNPTTRTTTVTSSTGTMIQTTTTENFDFNKTKWEAAANAIVGARSRHGVFVEMRASVFGASVVKVLAGFDF